MPDLLGVESQEPTTGVDYLGRTVPLSLAQTPALPSGGAPAAGVAGAPSSISGAGTSLPSGAGMSSAAAGEGTTGARVGVGGRPAGSSLSRIAQFLGLGGKAVSSALEPRSDPAYGPFVESQLLEGGGLSGPGADTAAREGLAPGVDIARPPSHFSPEEVKVLEDVLGRRPFTNLPAADIEALRGLLRDFGIIKDVPTGGGMPLAGDTELLTASGDVSQSGAESAAREGLSGSQGSGPGTGGFDLTSLIGLGTTAAGGLLGPKGADVAHLIGVAGQTATAAGQVAGYIPQGYIDPATGSFIAYSLHNLFEELPQMIGGYPKYARIRAEDQGRVNTLMNLAVHQISGARTPEELRAAITTLGDLGVPMTGELANPSFAFRQHFEGNAESQAGQLAQLVSTQDMVLRAVRDNPDVLTIPAVRQLWDQIQSAGSEAEQARNLYGTWQSQHTDPDSLYLPYGMTPGGYLMDYYSMAPGQSSWANPLSPGGWAWRALNPGAPSGTTPMEQARASAQRTFPTVEDLPPAYRQAVEAGGTDLAALYDRMAAEATSTI